jgi:hypothetical protein
VPIIIQIASPMPRLKEIVFLSSVIFISYIICKMFSIFICSQKGFQIIKCIIKYVLPESSVEEEN